MMMMANIVWIMSLRELMIWDGLGYFRTHGVSPRRKYCTPVQLPPFLPAAGD